MNRALLTLALTLGTASSAMAASCGSFDGKFCTSATQYAGSFNPGVGYGGFGGGTCTATKTPVIFVHGNADNAQSWDAPPAAVPGYAVAPKSSYQAFKAAGYNDCELFAVTWLSSSERGATAAAYNYHSSTKYAILKTFIDKVKAYTGKSQVDIVSHSMGVSLALATLQYHNKWTDVRKFIGIGGGLRGLNSCYLTGPANALAPTCGSQNIYDSNKFGFFPEGWYYGVWYANGWTSSSGTKSMRNMPAAHTGTTFYTIFAGQNDQVACSTTFNWSTCGDTSKFNSASNVRAQLNVGAGSTALAVDYNWKDGSWTNLSGGDTNGVGHFRSRQNTGAIQVQMLNTTCMGTGCASTYSSGPYK